MTHRLFDQGPIQTEAQTRFSGRIVSVDPRDERWAVVLDQTLFYPASGGQPCDVGVLGGAQVLDVLEDGEAIVHMLDATCGEPGAEVSGQVDLGRRRDHMEQHSGQHLLSAVLLRHEVPTLSFHLGAELATIDVPATRVDAALLTRVEAEVNASIRQDLPVTATVYTDTEALAATLRKVDPVALASPRGVRVVQIGEDPDPVDRDACCGTHVSSTGELGTLVVLGCERGRKGEARITFAVGGRAIREVRQRLDALQLAARSLTTGYPELPSRATKLLSDVKDLKKELKQVRRRALSLEATTLAGSHSDSVLTHLLEGGEAKDAGAFARAFVEARPDATAVVAHRGQRLTLVVTRGPRAAHDAAVVLRGVLASFGGKGGGSAEMAQGSAPDPDQADQVLAAAAAALE